MAKMPSQTEPRTKRPGLMEMPVFDEPQAAVIERADIVPADGYVIEVDGRLKQRFDDKSDAQKAALQLKQKFPMLQVKVYNAIEKSRTLIDDAPGVAPTD
jgi:hypothetical protein